MSLTSVVGHEARHLGGDKDVTSVWWGEARQGWDASTGVVVRRASKICVSGNASLCKCGGI